MEPTRVLFVCTANICRSAYAEARARQLLAGNPGIAVSSAGVYGYDDAPLDDAMAVEALARGAEVDRFRSRPLRPRHLDEADLVLAAASEHRGSLLRDHPRSVRKVFTFTQFVDGLRAAPPDLCGPDLIAHVGRHRPAVHPDGDVIDPYRRGPAAAAACARHLDELLGEILPRLAR